MKYPALQYHDYLQLDKVLDAQKLRSEEFNRKAHDEMLFIIVHQTYELWFKQILWELRSAQAIFQQPSIPEREMGLASQRLQRVIEILRLILGQIDVLETMTALDFLDFREFLYPASGFQSFQFRQIEMLLGLRTEDRTQLNKTPFHHLLKEKQKSEAENMMSQKSLFDLMEDWLARLPLLETKHFSFWKEYQIAVEKMFDEDTEIIRTNPRLTEDEKTKNLKMMQMMMGPFQSLFDEEKYKTLQESGYFRMGFKSLKSALMIQLYRDEPLFQTPFKILSHFLDIDELLTQWRYRHALMAHRMLGKKIGTGGSSGSDYLKDATEKHKIFTDLFNLSTFLIPRSKIPTLPKEIQDQMGFRF